MKKKLVFALLASFAFSGLAGCSSSGENYYTIDVYSDYVGMEEDLAAHGRYTVNLSDSSAMAAVGLKKVGYCYAVKGKDAKLGGMTLLDSNFNGKKSTRTPASGHKYVFDAFAGYYSSGAAIDLASIQSNCAVFATFTDELIDYSITVRDAYKNTILTASLNYGQTASEYEGEDGGKPLADLLSTPPSHDTSADPDDYSTWRDAHYIDYTFLYWRFSVEGEKTATGWTYDSSEKRSHIDLTPTEASAYAFAENTRIDPVYDETNKSYEVKLSYQVRTFNESLQAYEYATPVEVAPQTIAYGGSVNEPVLGLTGYACVGEGKDGIPTRYGDDMDIAEGEILKKLPNPLCELYDGGYRGTVVNRGRIVFGCSLTLIFVENPKTYDLVFHTDCADASVTTNVEVTEGKSFTTPSATNITAGKTFADWGVKDSSDNLVIADLTTVTSNMELFPILVDSTLVSGNLTYTYDSDLHGYSLTLVDKAATSILASDIDLSIFPKDYPLYGIDSFSAGSGVTGAKLTTIELPAGNQIDYLAHGLFNEIRLSQVTKIDLKESEVLTLHSYEFHNLPRVTEIYLPASLHSVGADLFSNCTQLTKVSIDLTEAEVSERVAAKEFSPYWYGDLDPSIIVYKA